MNGSARQSLEELAAKQERLIAEVRELGFLIAELRRESARAGAEVSEPPAAAAPVPPPLPPREALPLAGVERVAAGEPAARGAIEVEFGRVWLVRIGMLILLAGIVFLANYAWQAAVRCLGPAGKLALLALAGAGIGGLGFWLERWRAEMAGYSKVLIAGGASVLYYTAFAGCYVPALRVVSGGTVSALVMLAAAAGLVMLADRRRSATIATLGVAFSFFTAAVQPPGAASLLGHVALAAATAFLVLRHQWIALAYLGIAAAFGSAAWWRFATMFGVGFFGREGDTEFWIAIPSIAGCWAIFTACGWFFPAGSLSGPARASLISAANAGAFAAASFFVALASGQNFAWWCGGFGLVLGVLCALAHAEPGMPEAVRAALFAQSMLLIAAAIAMEAAGAALALTLAVQAALIVVARAKAGALSAVAVACAIAAGSVWFAVRDAANVPGAGWTTALPAALILFFGARVLSGTGPRAAGFAFALCGVISGAAAVLAIEYPGYQPSFLAGAFALGTCTTWVHGIRALPPVASLWLLLALWRCFFEPWDGLFVNGFGQNGIAIALSAVAGAVWWRGRGVRPAAAILAGAATASYFLWVLGALAPAWRAFAILLAAAVLMALAVPRASSTLRWSALGLAAAGYVSSGIRAEEAALVASLSALGIWLAVPPAARSVRGAAFGRAEAVAGFLGWLLAWILCVAKVPSSASGFALTLTTGAVAGAALSAGVLVRVRAWRWAGLILAMGAILKAVIADAWSLGTPARIVSFLGLGAMLMGVGFLYNRHAEQLKKWL